MHAASLRMRGQQCRHHSSSSSGTSRRRTAVPTAAPSSACRALPARARRLVAARSSFPATNGSSDPMPASPVAAQALQEYFDLERAGALDQAAVAELRLRYGFRRCVDGRVQLRRSDGVWMSLKLDMEMRGTMLLRDTDDSSIHVLMTDHLEQLDLSDDYLLLMLFADGAWEGQTKPIELGNGRDVEALRLDAQQFKDFVGLIKTLEELEEAERAEEAAAGRSSGSGGSSSGGGGGGLDGPEIDVTAERVNGR